MSCKCCCTNILDLCKVGSCSEVNFDILAQDPGVHVLVVDFLNSSFRIEKEFEADEIIKFPVTGLNENYTFKGQLLDPNGKTIVIRKNGVDYDCVKFKTRAVHTIT